MYKYNRFSPWTGLSRHHEIGILKRSYHHGISVYQVKRMIVEKMSFC